MPSLSDQAPFSTEHLPEGHYFKAFVSPGQFGVDWNHGWQRTVCHGSCLVDDSESSREVEIDQNMVSISDNGGLKGIRFPTLVANYDS